MQDGNTANYGAFLSRRVSRIKEILYDDRRKNKRSEKVGGSFAGKTIRTVAVNDGIMLKRVAFYQNPLYADYYKR